MKPSEGHELARDVFDNGDYMRRQEELKNPAHPTLRFIGRAARLLASNENAEKVQRGFDSAVTWWKSQMGSAKEAYTRHRAQVKETGSLDIISDQFAEQNEPIAPAHPVGERTGIYRSNLSKEPPQPDVALGPDEMHDIMQIAAARARANLGRLPIIHKSTRRPLPTRKPQAHAGDFKYGSLADTTPNQDERLLSRLEAAFRQTPAGTPTNTSGDRERPRPYIGHDRLPPDTGGRHRAKEEDDQNELDSTNA